MTVIQYSHYSQVNSSSDKATAKKAVKSEAAATEIDEENDTKEYQCYYCGLMIVSVRNVKDHMQEKHRRFHSKVSKPFLRWHKVFYKALLLFWVSFYWQVLSDILSEL